MILFQGHHDVKFKTLETTLHKYVDGKKQITPLTVDQAGQTVSSATPTVDQNNNFTVLVLKCSECNKILTTDSKYSRSFETHYKQRHFLSSRGI